ncbi:cyclic nucleotide-binding domain-containing protein [Legionella longbeachae]|uniref:Putative cAMP/cGMP binding protein n=1 Tax=Legionella longbeachae serogroup 1 (strain NSW150) TaxID=661367 RepID=D3HK43_LEGLN|nr:cyclic nucleotide-binding domain-containing protein [Legionella longbeachae]VEE03326.1 cAMP/cGMP binding protein [Legionella oakridgensis]HBD7399176.1 cyclic nucleotide-binding domain-containing protein [Legionella pneumophila]ARB93778.1 cyclic nucleotide-binding domain-containing protein [Legionella longbeachae]ARM33082.1 cyclic nucleotide-binding domain-containing protein [Legionella longbeachae]EEZ94082.1 cyclic nucleotide-binding domain protein [Legionella longbeachae D-4968]
MEEFDLHNCSLFRGVDEKYIDEFLASCEPVQLRQGEFLFHQNEIGDAMYIVEQGKLEVVLYQGIVKSDPQIPHVIGTRERGDLIGELCVFGQRKRSASVRALVDSQLLKIEGEDFRIRIYSKELDALLISYNIAKVLSERLITTNTLLTMYLPFKI